MPVLERLNHIFFLFNVHCAVGSFAGAITGGLIGLATESGLLRGAGIGAISGAVFSIEVLESSLTIWYSNRSGISSILFVVCFFKCCTCLFSKFQPHYTNFFFFFQKQIDTILSLLSGRLVREKIGPAMQNAVQNQVNSLSIYLTAILN